MVGNEVGVVVLYTTPRDVTRHRPLSERGRAHGPMDVDEMKGSFLRWLLSELATRGYSLSWGIAEAADYGVPQLRQRAIVIGVLGLQPCFLPQRRTGYLGSRSTALSGKRWARSRASERSSL